MPTVTNKLDMRVQKIKDFVEDIDQTGVAAICERMRDGLEGRSAEWLAGVTGDKGDDVRRWLRGTNKPPIDFVARYCKATDNSADWVLLGYGPRRAFPPGEAQEALARIIQNIPPHLLTFVKPRDGS